MPAGARVLLCAAVVAALGCNIDNPGDEPPHGLLYFPNAMVLSKHDVGEAARYLFVANSDFDLRYSAGSVQAFSLDRLKTKVDGCRDTADCYIDPAGVLEDEISINPFATSLALSSNGDYLFAPTRTDDSLTFIHVNATASGNAVLDCGNANRLCGLHAQRGPDRLATKAQPLTWPVDPVAVIAGPLSDWVTDGSAVQGDYVMVAHRAGSVSLFVQRPERRGQSDELLLTDVLSGLPHDLTEIAYDPNTKLVYLTVTLAGSDKLLGRVGIVLPEDQTTGDVDFAKALAYDAGFLQLDGVAHFSDTRDVSFIAAVPSAGDALAQNRALVVARDPDSLLLTDVDETRNPPHTARVMRTAVVGPGATRIVWGGFDGHPLAIVGSFGSRELTMVDLPTMLVRAVVPNLSGPFALALDEARNLLYVTDFRSSVIRIVDLAPLFELAPEAPVRVVATLGRPRVLQELQ